MGEFEGKQRLVNYTLGGSSSVLSDSPKGCQLKFCKDGFWYKQDLLGNEGLSEFLVSLVLHYSNLAGKYVDYEQCFINGRKGCRSFDFTSGMRVVSFQGLYYKKTLKKLSESYKDNWGISYEDVYQEVLRFFESEYNFRVEPYLVDILALDFLVLNNDRHFNNLCLLQDDSGALYRCPIFDNGGSLLTTIEPYFKLDKTIPEIIKERFSMKPFGLSFTRDLVLHKNSLFLDYVGIFLALSAVEDSEEKTVLLYQLNKYRDLYSRVDSIYGLIFNGELVGSRICSLGSFYDTSFKFEKYDSYLETVLSNGRYFVKGYEDAKEVNAETVKQALIGEFSGGY